MKNLKLAPIALFTFKRPTHTRRTLESLAQNPEFQSSPLFIYCDGARHEAETGDVEDTRRLLRNWPHPNKTLIERECNWGLAKSVIEGVTQLCSEYGRVIVVEDDLVVSPVFLNYLNAALVRYADEPKVMQVSAHMFPVTIESDCDAVMLPFTTSWGWATWARAWKQFDPTMANLEKLKVDSVLRHRFDLNGSYPYFRMLKRQAKGQVDSWAIRWYASVFFQNGYVVFPKHSLVQHEGYDYTATHAKHRGQGMVNTLWLKPIIELPKVILNEEAQAKIHRFFRTERSLLKRLFWRLGLG